VPLRRELQPRAHLRSPRRPRPCHPRPQQGRNSYSTQLRLTGSARWRYISAQKKGGLKFLSISVHFCVGGALLPVRERKPSEGGLMAAKRTKKFRRSPADINKAWQKLEPELAKQRKERERQGETFTSITREEFEAKLKRVNSPMI